MAARLGNVLYWTGCVIAALLLLTMLANVALLYMETSRLSAETVSRYSYFSVIAAVASWLIGRAFRYVLAGR